MGGKGGGPVCKRSRGTRNQTEAQKSKIFLICPSDPVFIFVRSKCLDYIVITVYGLCVAWQLSEIILGFSRGSRSKCT